MFENFPVREYLGNLNLWNVSKMAFFASRNSSEMEKEKIRCWGRNQAKNGVCFIGTFHSDAEKALLHTALKNGGSAVWILGKSIPVELSHVEGKALDEDRLLILSCHQRLHYSTATSRFANHISALHADTVVFASISRESLLYPFYRLLHGRRTSEIIRVK
ncbi:MAG: hypothetical protein SOZ02_08040 [Hallerella porci]|uniref:Uncharacterized protein n=1 Tax=Hallerella porci TaxID=1945871 RepID=A0ABX5LME7_9BACT|nr:MULTISPECIES: hypothetical protein [Hallerella]MCI5599826.1 hypothetical protein [Hallerella sp.]MDY3922094.1 hypothetical protein [Hallerella porci]PWL03492.1 hypothetical protein B0H50_10534 [Hallerella porci]